MANDNDQGSTFQSEDSSETGKGAAPSGELGPAQEDLDALRRQLAERSEEVKAWNEKYLRLAAEFENYKRRAQRDRDEGIRFANEKILKDLLPIIDNLERAIQSSREQASLESLIEGVELTRKQFLETLTKLGVQTVTSLGQPFDPTKHQAIAQVESETAAPNTVVNEYQKGYFLHERILRPAMVTVAKGKPQESGPSDETTQPEEGAQG